MLKWDPQAVATFLQAQPVAEDNSSYTFTFEMLGGVARLQVFPYTGDVDLTVEIGDHETAAIWRLECSAITYNDERPKEGGSSIAFIPTRHETSRNPPSHWVVLGRSDSNFEILTVFRNAEA